MWEAMGQNGIKKRFRGSYELRVDDRGRIKVPSRYLSVLEEHYGSELYITSINGDRVYLYPLGVWEEIEQSIEKIKVRSPEIEAFITRTSFWGNESEVDSRGRVLIPPELRSESQLNDNVRIFGKIDHMELWNEENFKAQSLSGRFSDEQRQRVSQQLSDILALSAKE